MIDCSTSSDVSSVLAANFDKVNGYLNCTWCNDVRQWFIILQVKKHMDGSTLSICPEDLLNIPIGTTKLNLL